LKYGLLVNPSKNTVNEINEFARLGFDYTEISFEEPCGATDELRKNKKKILAALRKNKMFQLGHSAYWVDFGSMHNKVREGWINEATEMIDVAKDLGIKFMNFHFYPGNGMTKKTVYGRRRYLENFTESMKILTSYAKKRGVTLMLENIPHGKRNPYTIKEFGYIIKNVPGLMVHLDLAHAYIEGGNKKIEEYAQKFQNRIVHLHLSDNNGKEDQHLPLGDGKINLRRAIAALKKIGYDRTITFEVFTSDSDARKSRIKFEKLWEKD
jgi:sugar phosphate isomerase/epimerase